LLDNPFTDIPVSILLYHPFISPLNNFPLSSLNSNLTTATPPASIVTFAGTGIKTVGRLDE